MAAFVKTESGKRLTDLMTRNYFTNAVKAQEGAFVVWIAIVVPAEILLGFDKVVYAVPESFAAMTAARGYGPAQSEKAEKMGYSMDLCSYARIDMGGALDDQPDSPAGRLPRPHLLVSNNNNCSLLAKWFDVYHREWDIPHFILDVPFCYERQSPDDRNYILLQFRSLIRAIEELSGQRFDLDRVREAVGYSSEAGRHWKQFLKCAEHRPSGITAFDSFVQMAPTLTMRGTPELTEHYRLLADETEDRVRRGVYPVPDEHYRLLWDNIAPWHQLRKMQQRLADAKANIVTASYTYCLGCLEGDYAPTFFDPNGDPLEYLARIQNFSVCPQGMQLRRTAMTEAIRRVQIDGVVFASNRSCKPYSLMQMDQLRAVSRDTGIPAVMVDVDHADVRSYNESSVFLRIEALLERIDAMRGH
ncbi:MAG: 2-hydroxyacyl-CoA dehydratase subunit D [Thermodesulfobacteriota bacterium]